MNTRAARRRPAAPVPDRAMTAVDILGIQVWCGPVRRVVKYVDRRIAAGTATRIAFLNAHLSNLCSRDPTLRDRLDHFLVLNDGIGVDIARRALHGAPFPWNLNGTDFVTSFLDQSRYNLRVFLLGAHPDVVGRVATEITRRWPRHSVVGIHDGYFDEAEEAAISAVIAQSQPHLVLVAMGNPLQERWIAAHVPETCACAMAVGAWFDFTAGVVPRAPAWMRRLRCEWLFRLACEPRRLAGRYLLGNTLFLGRISLAWAHQMVFAHPLFPQAGPPASLAPVKRNPEKFGEKSPGTIHTP